MRHLLAVSIKGTPPELGTSEVESSDESAGEALKFEDWDGCVGGKEYGGGGEVAS